MSGSYPKCDYLNTRLAVFWLITYSELFIVRPDAKISECITSLFLSKLDTSQNATTIYNFLVLFIVRCFLR